jgi:hypothetical protein
VCAAQKPLQLHPVSAEIHYTLGSISEKHRETRLARNKASHDRCVEASTIQKGAKIQAEHNQKCMIDCASKPAQRRNKARKKGKVSDISYRGGGKGSDSE